MIVEWSTRLETMEDKDEYDVEDMSSYEKSGAQLAWLD